jgi:AraC-like DNA-binding protein
MGRTLRLCEGRFGRLVLGELASDERIEAQSDPIIALQSRYDAVLFLNPGEVHVSPGPTRILVLHAARAWLRSGFPAAFHDDEQRVFAQGVEPITPRIASSPTRRSRGAERPLPLARALEFMLQELLLSIVDTYLARGASRRRLWRGSRLRGHPHPAAPSRSCAPRPNKELNMDELASQVGLSRSRFYDLFQMCTGFSPRATSTCCAWRPPSRACLRGAARSASWRPSSASRRSRTSPRFFLNQVGVPPSEYRPRHCRFE